MGSEEGAGEYREDPKTKEVGATSSSGVDPDQIDRFRALGALAYLRTYGKLGTEGWQDRSAERLSRHYRNPD